MADTKSSDETQAPSIIEAVERGLDALIAPGVTITQSELARAIVETLEAAGYVIVPAEGTAAALISRIREMHDAWQKEHSYSQGMSGGYGNPLLAIRLMERIESMR